MTDASIRRDEKRLSSPTVVSTPVVPFTSAQLTTLRRAASVLIPSRNDAPACGSLSDFEQLASRALGVMEVHAPQLRTYLDDLAGLDDAAVEQDFRAGHASGDSRFYWLSTLVTGIYVYSDQLRDRFGYPGPTRNPPDPMQAVEEIESGILDPVIDRGPLRCSGEAGGR